MMIFRSDGGDYMRTYIMEIIVRCEPDEIIGVKEQIGAIADCSVMSIKEQSEQMHLGKEYKKNYGNKSRIIS